MVKAFLHVDYKMKSDPTQLRERTTELYGKSGMSWSGAVVIFKRGDGTESDLSPNARVEGK